MSAARTFRNGRVPARQAGLSLIELLVAMTLGTIVTIGIVQMFTANQETYQVNIGQARMQENARFAMEFLTAPIRMAGFTGCFSEEDGLFFAVNDVGAGPPYEADFAAGALAGHEATSANPPGTWSPALAALPADIDTATIAPGTDVLTVRLTDSNGLRIQEAQIQTTDQLRVREPSAENAARYAQGTLMVVSDCQKAAVFQATGTTLGSPTRIDHVGGAAGVAPGNSTQNLSIDNTPFGEDATLHAVETQIFFVAPGAGLNNRGDNPLSLWRKFGSGAPTELVEGIEDLQVLYGVDIDQDGVPNRYRTIQTVADLSEIVTVRLSVTANSVDVVNETGDGLLRRTFTNTIALRNRL